MANPADTYAEQALAQAYVTALQPAVAALAEAEAACAEASGDDAKSALGYAVESVIVAVDRLRITMRRLSNSREAQDRASGAGGATPVLSNVQFRALLATTADKLEALRPLAGVGAIRAAKALRVMVTENNPTIAAQVYAQAEAILRVLKKSKVAA